MRLRIGLFFVMLTCGWAQVAYADIDYLCLKHCKDDGNTTQSCMENCRIQEDIPTIAGEEALTAGSAQLKEFSTPQDTDKIILNKKVQLQRLEVKTDYVCLNSCLKEGLQYTFCEKKCRVLSDPRTH